MRYQAKIGIELGDTTYQIAKIDLNASNDELIYMVMRPKSIRKDVMHHDHISFHSPTEKIHHGTAHAKLTDRCGKVEYEDIERFPEDIFSQVEKGKGAPLICHSVEPSKVDYPLPKMKMGEPKTLKLTTQVPKLIPIAVFVFLISETVDPVGFFKRFFPDNALGRIGKGSVIRGFKGTNIVTFLSAKAMISNEENRSLPDFQGSGSLLVFPDLAPWLK